MVGFVAYYRVSTDRQGRSGLGLDAQRAAVASFMVSRGELSAEFVEVESGRKNDRPQLAAALEQCRRQRAILVIAKLDRLARNVAFVATLMESGAEFVAVDNPHADKLMLHMLSAFAEHEQRQISFRTKAALAAAKARGVKLGGPNPAAAAARGRAALNMKEAPTRSIALPIIQQMRGEGASLRAIAAALVTKGVPPLRGQTWHPETIRKILLSSL
ncbi:recombinase family protein [Belnapia sp. F-4-1]|uniref:recombinase family protein n=1 Tax=Belnapia sp. F-4-1 TaxID=1545443 RepID=UPI0005BB1B46|nr:recombinase family protein [Belnapia sp. F-4-1]